MQHPNHTDGARHVFSLFWDAFDFQSAQTTLRYRRHQGSISLSRDVTFQASHRLALAFFFGNAFRYVFGGPRVAAHPAYDDAVQRTVGPTVSAPAEPVPDRLAAGRLDRAGAAQHGERRLFDINSRTERRRRPAPSGRGRNGSKACRPSSRATRRAGSASGTASGAWDSPACASRSSAFANSRPDRFGPTICPHPHLSRMQRRDVQPWLSLRNLLDCSVVRSNYLVDTQ